MEHQVQDRVDISLVVAVVVTMTIHQTLVVLLVQVVVAQVKVAQDLEDLVMQEQLILAAVLAVVVDLQTLLLVR